MAGLSRHGEGIVLISLGLPTALIDWQIARTWSLPGWISLLCLALAALAMGLVLGAPRLREAGVGLAVGVLYALPIVGAVVRWHLVPSVTALIGDGALQIQLARNLLLHGVDPYGFNYSGTGLERAPWGQPFPNPALHHLDYWPGTIVTPLPFQAAFQGLLGWWDERIWLLVVAAGVGVVLRWLVPGSAGRMAVLAFFLVPGHSLLAVLGDNDLPMIGLLLAAAVAIGRRRWLVSGLLIGLAIATKQTALIAVPVLMAWAISLQIDRRSFLRAAGLGAAVLAVLCAPFLLWNAGAFVRDTLIFNIGGGVETYPIQGIGLSAFLLQRGIIHGARDAFPFLLIQVPLLVGAWVLAWRWLRRHQRPGDAIIWMGVALFVFLFTNRFAQPTYMLLGVELMLAGLLARLDNSGHVRLALVRHVGGDGPATSSGDDARRHSVAD